MNSLRAFFFAIALVSSMAANPPGVVIDHSPVSSGLYIGSPSLVILPNGNYLASHDLFGPKSKEFEAPDTVIFVSTNRGGSWSRRATLHGQFWSGIFTNRGEIGRASCR